MSLLPLPLARGGCPYVKLSASRHGVGGIQQEVREHLTQRTSVNRKVAVTTVAGIDRDAACLKPRLVEIDHGADQLGHIRIPPTIRIPVIMQGRMGDLGNPLYLFLRERQVLAALLCERSLCFHEVEQANE